MSAEPMTVEVDGVVVSRALATMESAPQTVLAEAHAAAKALQNVLASKEHKVVMNGEQYLEFEDWQTLGRFYGITPKLEGLDFVEFPGEEGVVVRGFKATAVALRGGEVISRADAYCLNDEEKWSSKPKYAWLYVCADGELREEDPGRDLIVWEPNPNKPGKRPKKVRQLVGEEKVPLFQLASMAQTRANAKCLRNVLAWVAVLAGYRPTPAEELPDAVPVRPQPTQASAEAPVPPGPDLSGEEWPNDTTAYERHGVEPPPTRHTDGQRPVSPRAKPAPQGDLPACPKGHSGRAVMLSKIPKNGRYFCKSCGEGYGERA